MTFLWASVRLCSVQGFRLTRSCAKLHRPSLVSRCIKWPAQGGTGGEKCFFSTTHNEKVCAGQIVDKSEARNCGSQSAGSEDLEKLLYTKDNHEVESKQELLLHLISSNERTLKGTEFLREYVMTKMESFSLRFLPVLLSTLLKNECLSRPILHESARKIRRSLEGSAESYQDVNFGKLFWVYGKYWHYDHDLCESLDVFFRKGKLNLNPWMVSNMAWYCARVRFYDSSLLDKIAHYSLAKNDRFNLHDLSNVVYSFGYLNHKHETFMDVVGSRLESESHTEGNEQVYWVYVWSTLVMDALRPGLLERVLKKDFIQTSLKSPDYQLYLLQLSIALNYEHPELNLTAEYNSQTSKWGACFPNIKGLPRNYMRTSILARMKKYRHSGSANTFGENVKRALLQVVGKGPYFNTEALSISGYSLDFELLLDSKNRLVSIPRRWKMKSKEDVLYSINVLKSSKRKAPRMSTLIDSLTSTENSTESQEKLIVPTNFAQRVQLNLASDWGSKFEPIPSNAVKRIAIEADGLPHFARNCDHVLGPTVLKHRQLRALGWDVVQATKCSSKWTWSAARLGYREKFAPLSLQIPYREWEELQSGDDHVRYLSKKINIQ